MRVAVFGLGEAGGRIASDLAGLGVEVDAFDPAPVPTPHGVIRHDDPTDAIPEATLILAVTAAGDARTALDQGGHALGRGTIYADLSTAPPALKVELGTRAAEAELDFVDVALMGPVPIKGWATPTLASGPGADAFAEFALRHGGQTLVVGSAPGDAAARKLVRSVVTKGVTSLLIESLRAADALGFRDWLWAHVVEELTGADEELLDRLLDGTPLHLERRIAEMEAAEELLGSIAVETPMTRAVIESLQSVRERGMPPRT